MAVTWLSLFVVRDRSKEVGGGLTWWAIPAHSFEVWLGSSRRSKVDLPALIKYDDLVEDFVNCLRRLVDGNSMRGPDDVSTCSQSTDELECGCRIKPARTIVPTTDRRSRQYHLSDAD